MKWGGFDEHMIIIIKGFLRTRDVLKKPRYIEVVWPANHILAAIWKHTGTIRQRVSQAAHTAQPVYVRVPSSKTGLELGPIECDTTVPLDVASLQSLTNGMVQFTAQVYSQKHAVSIWDAMQIGRSATPVSQRSMVGIPAETRRIPCVGLRLGHRRRHRINVSCLSG